MDLAEVAVLEGGCVLVFIATKGRRETRSWKGGGGNGVFYLSLDREASGALLRLIVADEIDYLIDRDGTAKLLPRQNEARDRRNTIPDNRSRQKTRLPINTKTDKERQSATSR